MEHDPTAYGATALLLIGAVYFLPTILAVARGHRSSLAIFMVNLIFGWTFLGWLVAFIWACTGNIREHRRADPLDFHRGSGERVTERPAPYSPPMPTPYVGVPAAAGVAYRIVIIGLLALAVWALSKTANAQELPPSPPAEVEHNGSLMLATVLPDGDLEIRYLRPRPGLPVVPGQLLVRGRWIEAPGQRPGAPLVFAAISHSFPPGCPPVPYKVTGTTPDKWTMILTGPAPVVDPYGCVIVDWIWSKNSTLVFNFVRSGR